MAIQSVEVINLRFEYPGEGFLCAEGRTTARLTSLVLVTCEDGLTGVGPACTHPDLVQVIIEQYLQQPGSTRRTSPPSAPGRAEILSPRPAVRLQTPVRSVALVLSRTEEKASDCG